MNYLAHAYLTRPNNSMVLMGNLMGDFIKGNQFTKFEHDIQTGILLHRNIDTFTDAHELIREAKNIFRPTCGLYSGIMVDTLMDHFVANDKRIFNTDDDLKIFVKKIYFTCNTYKGLMTDKMEFFITNMIKYNWLYNYKFTDGIFQSYKGMQKRMPNFPDATIAFSIFEQNYKELGIIYTHLIEELEQEFLV